MRWNGKVMNNIERERIATKQLSECAQELRELRTFTAIDYEELEEQYGRADGKPIDGGIVHPNRDDIIGETCDGCPVPRVFGSCAVRTGLQELAAEHRAKYELATNDGTGNMVDMAEYFTRDQEIDFRYDDGWRQTG